jgi:hypothetical protein
VLAEQGLDRRLPDRETLEQAAHAWDAERNERRSTVDWRFTADDARIKLKRPYPAESVG